MTCDFFNAYINYEENGVKFVIKIFFKLKINYTINSQIFS